MCCYWFQCLYNAICPWLVNHFRHQQPRWRELPWNRRNQRTDVRVWRVRFLAVRIFRLTVCFHWSIIGGYLSLIIVPSIVCNTTNTVSSYGFFSWYPNSFIRFSMTCQCWRDCHSWFLWTDSQGHKEGWNPCRFFLSTDNSTLIPSIL